MKICTKCGESKQKTDFFFDAKGKEGLQARCKKCHNAASAAWRKANPEKQKSCEEAWAFANRDHERAYSAKWRRDNKERMEIARATWRANNQDRIKIVNATYFKNNKEKVSNANAAWLSANRAHATAYAAKQRARKVQATPVWANKFFIDEIYDLANRRTKLFGFSWHVDHIVPLKSKLVCGLHCEANLQVITGSENCSKNNRYWPEMPL